MDVILLQDVQTLGTAGDIVKVKPGYARNYLFPRGFALRSSKRNRAVAEEKKRNSKLIYAQVMNWFVAFVWFIFLGVTLNIEIFKYFVGPAFRAG